MSSDTQAVDEALAAVIMVDGGKDEEDGAIDELLDVVVDEDKTTQHEAVETIASHTRKTKKQAKELLKEQRGARSRELINVKQIEKIIPVGDSDEYRYRFDIVADGVSGVVELKSSNLMSQHSFKTQLFELTNYLADFDDWEKTLNMWMNDTEITEREELPDSPDHALAEALLNRIRGMLVTHDYEEFRSRSMNTCHHDEDQNKLLVAGTVVDDVRQDLNGEVSMQRARAILDPYLADSSKRVRNGDDLFRVWQFDADALQTHAGIGLETEGEAGGFGGDA